MVAPLYQKLSITEDQLAEFCRKHHIQRMSVFGSVLRDDFRPESDVDFLVEFEEGHHPGWDIVDVERELSDLIGGRDVDLVNPKYLNSQAGLTKCRAGLCQRVTYVISATCWISRGGHWHCLPG